MPPSKVVKLVFIAFLFVCFPFSNGWAYVSPIISFNILWAFWTVLVIILAAVGGLLIWPVRSFRRWKKDRAGKPDDNNQ